mmetsp:Transcript_47926/g.79487  ORF Transcript_47926/g.79487 Transcript_47926/m.79487 type:complete len:547 (-) Transcript_47926:81-1721(-)
MGCLPSSPDPLLPDIWSSFEQKYDFETIFPSDPSHASHGTGSNGYMQAQQSKDNGGTYMFNDRVSNENITDDEVDVNSNTSNLCATSDAYDILVDVNEKTSKIIIRLMQYKGNELQPIIKLGMNESKFAPKRQRRQPRRQLNPTDDEQQQEQQNDESNAADADADLIMKGHNHGLLHIELIIASLIRVSGVPAQEFTAAQQFFPNDIKSMIISFYSREHPKLLAFRVLIDTATLCKHILNLCGYIGAMLSRKLLFQGKLKPMSDLQEEQRDLKEQQQQDVGAAVIDQQSIMNDENATICRQLIFLFHYVLCLDQYKMPKQQPLTNNFTAYKRMHSDFANKNGFGGGGFASFKRQDSAAPAETNEWADNDLTDKELIPLNEMNTIAMFMGRGSTACIESICDSMSFDANSTEMQIMSQFVNGCLTLLKANGNTRTERNMSIVKYSLFIVRAMVCILLIIDTKKSATNQQNSVFGNNENTVKAVQCSRMITTQFMQYYGDDASIAGMQGVSDKKDIVYHINYCKRIIKFGAQGFKNGCVKRNIENMFG